MDEKEVLKELGLSGGEVKVYLALLKLGPSNVNKIAKMTEQHRTTVYDFLDHLSKKGLVSYAIKNRTKYYKIVDPEKLMDGLKEKESNLKEIMPKLNKLAEISKEEVSVEVYSGKEGFKTMLNDELRIGKDLYGFGIDETKFKEKFPIVMEQFLKKEAKLGIQEFLITKEKPEFIYKRKHVHYRYIASEYFNPTATAVYGDRTFFIIWEPLTLILIKNKHLADSFRKYHKMLWSIAKEK